MKSFKKLLAAAVLGLAIVPAISFAQPPPGGGGRGGRGMNPEAQVAAIDAAVTLTADQKTKVTAIVTKASEARNALEQEDRRGPKGQELTANMNKEIRALLTPEQATKFDAMPPPGRGGRGQGGPGGPGGGAGGAPGGAPKN